MWRKIISSTMGPIITANSIVYPKDEEIIFRHIILRRLLPFGEGFAVGICSLLFGLYHGNLAQFIYAFAVGWIFCIVALRTGKLIHTVLLHIAMNFLGSIPASLLLPYAEKYLSGAEIEMTPEAVLATLAVLGYTAVLLLLVAVGVGLFLWRRRALLPRRGEVCIPRGERRYLLFSPGCGVYLVAVFILFLLSYL